LQKILTSKTPTIVETSVDKMVGKIISDGDTAPIEERSAKIEDGII
jgi:hypothetical protein